MGLPEDYEATFRAADADGDGKLTVAELQALLARLGEPMDDATAARLIGAMDADNDGMVTREEMAAFLARR